MRIKTLPSSRPFDLGLLWSLDRFNLEVVIENHRELVQFASSSLSYRSSTAQCLDLCGVFNDAIGTLCIVIVNPDRESRCEPTVVELEKPCKAKWLEGRLKAIISKDKTRKLYSSRKSSNTIASRPTPSVASTARILLGSGGPLA